MKIDELISNIVKFQGAVTQGTLSSVYLKIIKILRMLIIIMYILSFFKCRVELPNKKF